MSKTEPVMYECLGGPLCGRMHEDIGTDIGIPAFAYDDDDGHSHYYRLARSKGVRYWHYLGMKWTTRAIRPYIKPIKSDT